MDLIKTYLDKTSRHLFKVQGKNTLKKVFPVQFRDELYAIKLEWDDDSITAQVYEAKKGQITSLKGKEYLNPMFKHKMLFEKDEDLGVKSYAIRCAKYYRPLMDHIREVVDNNKDQIPDKGSESQIESDIARMINESLQERTDLYKPKNDWFEKVKEMA